MVFVPALTTFVISDLLGGGKILLIGNVIEQYFKQNSNWHVGSGLSLVLMVFIIASAWHLWQNTTKKDEGCDILMQKILTEQYIWLLSLFCCMHRSSTLIVLSFNQSKTRAKWGGFTLKWYNRIVPERTDHAVHFYTTLIIAFCLSGDRNDHRNGRQQSPFSGMKQKMEDHVHEVLPTSR